ncbi:MAG: sugar ABC transporter substrate-binding protein [Microgenomates group bacterium Gr01-1014_93]|nr:MAG: sugar ABC transporter substrate-binding protein [Microgenomates group bacterium Gr01-1014_93]
MKIIIPIILVSIFIVGLLFWLGPKFLNKSEEAGQINLTYWGFWDEEKMRPIILEYEKQNPNIKISYTKQNKTFYRTRVQTQIREGTGPDVFEIRNSWLPDISSDLAPAPRDVISTSEYSSLFYPVAKNSLSLNDQIYALPLEINGLALFVNTDILKAAGISIPKTWQEFIDGAIKVTVKESGQVKTAGAALGATSNIDYWPEILGLLLLQQPGVNISSPSGGGVAEIIRFYTSFIIDPKRKTWDLNLPSSTQMFASGNLAFYFGEFEQIEGIKTLNPNLKFEVAPVPQLPGGSVAWGSFWGETVSRNSKHQKESWEFIKFLSQKQVILSLGIPPSRVDMAQGVTDPLMKAFISQGPIYKSWYLNSNIPDNGINDEMISVWKQALDSSLGGTAPEDTLKALQPKVQQVLIKYKK